VLINLLFQDGKARLIFKRKGERVELLDDYNPYFYAIAENPEEAKHLIEKHPLVLDAVIEHKYPKLSSREMEPVVKVVTSMHGFRRVIRDMGKVPGVKELMETSVPHHFRYVVDKDIRFFKGREKLRLASIGPKEDIPECDVLFTWGGDDFLKERRGVRSDKLGCFLDDCIHLDVMADMEHDIYNESDAEGLMELGKERLIRVIELSRMTGVKPDLVSRVTPGKLNTFLHMRAARKNGYLIPDTKKSMERPKSLRVLQMMDKGGTIFYPSPGIYRDVAKCDFASMYPNIIVKYNISPETMHCTCDDYIEVPEAGWRICKKKGLIPQGIEKVLRRRLHLKKLKRGTGKRIYDVKQRALKNILVTCFGYLAYSNFIFSNVENKECVMLFGRHILSRTKEIAEEMGLDVIYGIVDSVFVKNGTEQQYKEFVERVSDEFGIELELDCVFKAIAFPAAERGEGIANKYFGITYEGKIEARGIALRHSDAPEFIKAFQREAVPAFLKGDMQGFERAYKEHQDAVLSGNLSLEDFAITKSIRKRQYKVNAPHVVAYKQDPRGSTVTYVHSLSGPKPLRLARREEVDNREYLRLLEMKTQELISGLEGL
jgi:DNA polymerase elongation subunit (family B)